MISVIVLLGLALLTAGLSIPLVLGKVARNQCYGFRTRRTLSSDEIWYPANKYGGKVMIYWAMVMVFIGLITLPFCPLTTGWELFVCGILPLTVLIPCFMAIRWTRRHFPES